MPRDTRRTRPRTTRGLHRVPAEAPMQGGEAVLPARQPRKSRRRVKTKMFSFGSGLDMPLLILILVLLSIGLVMVFSASYAYSYYRDNNSYKVILSQGTYAILGVAAMLVISTFDYHRFHQLAYPLYAVSLVLLAAVLLFGRVLHIHSIAPPQDDAYRWLKLGVQFQPSEIAKFTLMALLAHYISQHVEKMGEFMTGAVKPIAFIVVVGGLVVVEPHMSGFLIIFMLGVVLMFIGGTKIRHLVILGVLGAGVLLLFLSLRGGGSDGSESSGGFFHSYQWNRVLGWLDPMNPPEGVDTWQTRQSLYAIGSGGLLGVGLGQSRQKYLWLPEPHNDFIFAVVCEELGLIGALVIIILFSVLIWRGVYISLHAKDKFGMLLGLGMIFQVGIQAVLNICVVTNTVPNTGIGLPFFSAGGTSLLMLLGEMGVLLNISRSASVERT